MLSKRDYKFKVPLELLRNYNMLRRWAKIELRFAAEEYG